MVRIRQNERGGRWRVAKGVGVNEATGLREGARRKGRERMDRRVGWRREVVTTAAEKTTRGGGKVHGALGRQEHQADRARL